MFRLSIWASIHPCRDARRVLVFQVLCTSRLRVKVCVSFSSAVVQ